MMEIERLPFSLKILSPVKVLYHAIFIFPLLTTGIYVIVCYLSHNGNLISNEIRVILVGSFLIWK